MFLGRCSRRPRCFWTIDAPAVHPQRMESFGGDLEHRLLALRIRCWWASPGLSFVAGGSGRLDGLVLRGAGISSNRRSTAPSAAIMRASGDAATQTPGEACAAPCDNVYRCSDGKYVALGIIEPHFWQRFCDAVGLADLRDQQWPEGNDARCQMQRLQVLFAKKAARRVGESFSVNRYPLHCSK